MAQKASDKKAQKSPKAKTEIIKKAPKKETLIQTQARDQKKASTGEAKEPILIFVNTLKASTLAYVDLEVSGSVNSPSELRLPIRALHDCGCAKTVIKTSTFMKLAKLAKIELKQNIVPTMLVTATGAREQITGIADIVLHFEGLNKTTIACPIEVIVHPELNYDFLLGRDFTGSEVKAIESNHRLYLTANPEKLMNEGSISNMVRKRLLCDVPLQSKKSNSKFVATNSVTTIPPYSMVGTTCSLQKSPTDDYRLPFNTAGSTTYEVVNATFPNIGTSKMLYQYEDPTEIYIPIYNETHREIILEQGTTVAEIELWNQTTEHEVHHVKLVGQELDHFECNNAQALPDFIADDEGMNEEEQQEAFMKYIRFGYHHPSMTKQVEERAALTEMTLQKAEPIKEKDLAKQFDIDHLSSQAQSHVRKIVQQHKNAFSKHPFDLGKAKGIQMKIPITTDEPHIQKYIPIPHSIRPQVREILDQYVERGIIRECDEPSAFCSNILVVKKKDGKSIRLLLDGRLLNNYTQRLPTNLVTQLEVFAHLVNKKWVTTIDLSDAFYQIELHPDSQPLTAFYSEAHGKRYCFMRCPQGLRNSPLHLKLVMDRLFSHMANDVIHYADDIMIATEGTLREHIDRLADVFAKLEQGNIKIRPQKVNIARESIDFLGIIWKKNTISIPESKLQAFRELASPNTPKKLKTMLCALGFYRHFVPAFADLAHFLMSMTTLHHKQYQWTEHHELLFRELIDTMCKNAVRYLPDPSKPYYVQTDASDFCGAGRVFQKDEEGNEMPLACISRTFTKTERAYSTVKKEVLALLYTLRTMDFFLRFANKIIILVDAQAILYLRLCKEASGILLRFSIELSKYEAEIIHVKGENNEVADVLSRQHKDIDKLKEEVKQSKPMSEKQTLELLNKLKIPKNYHFTKEEVADMLDAPSLPNPAAKKAKESAAKAWIRTVSNMPKTLHNRKIKMPKEVKYAPGAKLPTKASEKRSGKKKKEEDEKEVNVVECNSINIACNQNDHITYKDLSTVSTAILKGYLTTEQFKDAQAGDPFCARILEKVQRLKNYTLIKGLLFFKTRKNTKLVMPNSLLDVIINAKHYSVFGLHFSKTRILRDICTRYHVQHAVLRKKLQRLKNECVLCQYNITGQKDHTLTKTDFVYAPRVTWAIDIMPNLPTTVSGNKKAMLAVDMFTGYIQVYPMPDRTAKSLIKAIDEAIVRPFTVPKFIRADNEPGLWTANEFYEYLQPLGVKFLPTSVGSPWANGHAERSIRTIKDALRTFLLQEKITENWDKYINLFTAAHNQSTSIYGFAPEELMFGYRNPSPHDLLQFWPNSGTQVDSQADYAAQIFPLIEEKRQEAKRRSDQNKERNRNFKNERRIKKEFTVGQIVACRQLQVSTGPNSSLKPRYLGPYAVIALMKDKCSCIIESLATGNQSKEHFTNLIPINYHPDHNRVHSNFDDEIEAMVDNLQNNRYNIKASTRRLLKIPLLPEDQLDHIEGAIPNDHNVQSDPATSDPATPDGHAQADANDGDQRGPADEINDQDQADAGPSGLQRDIIDSTPNSSFEIIESDSDSNFDFFGFDDEEIDSQEYHEVDFGDDDDERERRKREGDEHLQEEERERAEPDLTQSESESENEQQAGNEKEKRPLRKKKIKYKIKGKGKGKSSKGKERDSNAVYYIQEIGHLDLETDNEVQHDRADEGGEGAYSESEEEGETQPIFDPVNSFYYEFFCELKNVLSEMREYMNATGSNP